MSKCSDFPDEIGRTWMYSTHYKVGILLETTRPCPVLDFLTAELAVDTLSAFMLPTPLNPFCYSFT